MKALPAAQIAWYVTGRFYAKGKTIADYGYFLHLGGMTRLFVDRITDAAHAHFTFAAQPFEAPHVANGDLSLSLDPVGEFSIYLQREPRADFDRPDSFAAGERIATFRRLGLVVTTTVEDGSGNPPPTLFATNAFSAQLTFSQPFEFDGQRHDLGDVLPHGVTQFGTASTTSIASPPTGYATVLPFTGSAIAIGRS